MGSGRVTLLNSSRKKRPLHLVWWSDGKFKKLIMIYDIQFSLHIISCKRFSIQVNRNMVQLFRVTSRYKVAVAVHCQPHPLVQLQTLTPQTGTFMDTTYTTLTSKQLTQQDLLSYRDPVHMYMMSSVHQKVLSQILIQM